MANMLVASIQFSKSGSYPIVCCSLSGSVLSREPVGGDEGIRTPGLRLAKAALSQLSYIPLVGLPGFEPGTFPLSEERSNQLS